MSKLSSILFSAFLILSFSHATQSSAQNGQIKTILIQGNSELLLLIRERTIGLLLTEKFEERPQDAFRALAQLGIESIGNGQDRLVLLKTDFEGQPSELLKQAITLREENPDLIAQAGYIAEFVDTNDPMLVTDQLVIQFEEGVSTVEAEAIAEEHRINLLFENPYIKGEFLAAIVRDEGFDTLEVSNKLNGNSAVNYAHPNFIRRKIARQAFTPNDNFFANQWHHNNTGQSVGLVDADIDSDLAWGISLGNAATIIAVIDGGFDIGHPDLTPNYWTNAGEIAGDGIDNDGNGQVDDALGWDMTGCDIGTPSAGCGDANPTGPDTGFGRHGTAVAGAAAARGNNALGVSGTCPNCTIMPVRISSFSGAFGDGLAFGYAQANGASIITNSWGYALNAPTTNNVLNAINNATNNGRSGLGSIVLFAMNTTGSGFLEDCAAPGSDISSPANVIAIGASSNTDQRTPSGYGNCMDLLAPTDNSGAAGGTLWAVTTDMRGSAGYNNNAASIVCPSIDPTVPPASNRDYTFCFGGTSFATPVTAGIAGLILSVRPNLTRLQVQRILQDTADKIDPAVAAYGDNSGFSNPTTPPQMGFPVGSTHGHGRVNAFEAVRLASPIGIGRNGTDIVIRDNRLDWGNTEQPSNVRMDNPRGFIAHYRSVDIKVDAPPFAATAPATSVAFDAFVDEDPLSGTANRVYVRVRNRGPVPATSVTAKLHWASAGAGLPALPTDFWSAFPADSSDTSIWHPTSVETLGTINYSGSSVAGTGADGAQIATFNFDAPAFDASLPDPDHYCLFVVIESDQDHVSSASMASLVPDLITPNDNNVTHRNVKLVDSGRAGRFETSFYVNNPFDRPIRTMVRIKTPKGWDVSGKNIPLNKTFGMEPKQRVLVEISVVGIRKGALGTVEAQQLIFDGQNKETVLGGIDFEVSLNNFQPQLPDLDILKVITEQQIQLGKLLNMIPEQQHLGNMNSALETIREVSKTMQSQNRLLLDDNP